MINAASNLFVWVATVNLLWINQGLRTLEIVAFTPPVSPGRLVPNSKAHCPHPVKYQWKSDSLHKVLATTGGSPLTSFDSQDRALARQYIQNGMESFRNGDVSKSIEYFNAAEQNDKSITPYLWQRGLSYYYNQQYEKASQQFRIDVSVNPYDVEEIVWDIASQLQYYQNQNLEGTTETIFPIPNQLSLPPGSKDRRKIMGYVYKLFRGEGTEQDLALAGSSKDASLSDEFYAFFYLSLYNKVFNRPGLAELYLRQALATTYGQKSNDYMVSCAKLQSKLLK